MSKAVIQEFIKAREEYVEKIRTEMLGPGSEFLCPDVEHELVSSSPMRRYCMGILYPQGIKMDLERNDTMDDDDEYDGEPKEIEDEVETEVEEKIDNEIREISEVATGMDEDVNLAAQFMPSSMGITFVVDKDVQRLRGKVTFGTYVKIKDVDGLVVKLPLELAEPEKFEVKGELAKYVGYDKETHEVYLKKGLARGEVKKHLAEVDDSEETRAEFSRKVYRLISLLSDGYARQPHELDFEVDFLEGNYSCSPQNAKIDGTHARISALKTKMLDGQTSLTVMLSNDIEDKRKAEKCIFQPRITIKSDDNDFRFCEIQSDANFKYMDEEEQSLELLYRRKQKYATGLDVSTDWKIDENGGGEIRTEFMPVAEMPQMDFRLPKNGGLTARELSMKYFSDLNENDKNDKLAIAKKLVDMYENWIEGLKKTAKKLDSKFKSAAARNIAECEKAAERMYAGIETLRKNELAYQAFELANRAMFMQRVHLRMQRDNRAEDCLPQNAKITKQLMEMNYYNEEDDETAQCWWRPFQLAFILMDIDSIVEDDSEDRQIVDLIWFPTGGGKTEAYLGLTAFTIFYRRLAHREESKGTTVIMRYTLRLLTAQQFNRASTLICACEAIRDDSRDCGVDYPSYDLGDEPITIGLWIGSDHAPNTRKVASEALKELRKPHSVSSLKYAKEKNKFQVLRCPWCGTKLEQEVIDGKVQGKWGYMTGRGNRFKICCTNDECSFRKCLPIQIVDEDLYEKPPTLLFATVDKFAMMPWMNEVGAFFGTRPKDHDNRAPELIIQDELHLISGSLGTIVGLYESAIDALCSTKGVMPKIVASTATIRRANEQCSNLYNRNVSQFPAPGLDASDSFFAREQKIDHDAGKFGRVYVGVMPSGWTRAMTQIRLFAYLLQSMHDFDFGEHDVEIKDAYWTIASYYSSLNELGSAATAMRGEVQELIRRVAQRKFTKMRGFKERELTSRINTTELNNTLNDLQNLKYRGENIDYGNTYPIGVVLATNMISVGIDIDRLNVMMMQGQPKTTSEYIQASSRVGRQNPGVIFVQYDSTRSRDRSHYESFKSYHESFYRFVEPTGVTPFSRPARERALHTVVLAIFRQQAANIGDEKNAANFDKRTYKHIIDEIQDFFANRVKTMNARNNGDAEISVEEVEREIEEFFEDWDYTAKANRDIPLYYGKNDMRYDKVKDGHRRLLITYDAKGHDGMRRALTSMRNVDSDVKGKIIIREEDE